MKTKTRRMAYWWFRIVVSGRFLEKFLNLRRVRRTQWLGSESTEQESHRAPDARSQALL